MGIQTGQRVAAYEIVSPLGAGGMGEVYRALDLKLKREVAIKVLPEEFSRDPKRLARFQREARLLAALNHPKIATLYGLEEWEGRQLLVMELVEGETLNDRIRRGPMSLYQARELFQQIAVGLRAAHAKGIVHRDLKPGNLMITKDGDVKILDFGLAKRVSASSPSSDSEATTVDQSGSFEGSIVGTRAYMPPEQALGAAVDARADIYAMGLILYEMLTGRRPTLVEDADGSDSGPLDVQRAFRERSDDLTTPLRRLVERATTLLPEHRFQSIEEFADALIEVHEPDTAVLPGRARQLVSAKTGPTAARPWRWALFAAAATILAIVMLEWARNDFFDMGSARSVAVLPFRVPAGDVDLEPTADGIAEGIIFDLSRTPGLRVISRASSFRLRDIDAGPERAGALLGTEAVLLARIDRDGDSLVVTTELVRTEDGTLLKGQVYRGEMDGLRHLHTNISADLVAVLRPRLAEGWRETSRTALTESERAYHSYLLGLHHWNRRSREGLETAIEHFTAATHQDPRYALAYAGLANAYALMGSVQFGPMGRRDAMGKAKSAAIEALEIDPSLAPAHAALAFVSFWYEWDTGAAGVQFRRAIESNPNYATAHQWYADYLAVVGSPRLALAEITEAHELDPLSPIVSTAFGMHLYYADRNEEASERFRDALELDGDFIPARLGLGAVRLRLGEIEAAVLELEHVQRLVGAERVVAQLGYAYASQGRRAVARRMLRSLEESAAANASSPLYPAVVHVGLGQLDEAMEWLEKGYEERSHMLDWLYLEPMMEPLRAHPRFQDLTRRIGIPEK